MYNNNYNYYPQQNLNQQHLQYLRQSSPATLKGRPVSSLDEVRASAIDFDGSIFYFPDMANKCIYTKQINIDGTAILNKYELKEIPTETSTVIPQLNNFITRDEFEAAINQLRVSMMPASQTVEPQHPQKQEILSF